MSRRLISNDQKERLKAFGKKVETLALKKGWSGADLAREMERLAPNGVKIGRHLPTAYIRGESEPTKRNLGLLAGALGVNSQELLAALPSGGPSDPQFILALNGRMRIILNVEVDEGTGLKIRELLKEATLSAT